MALDGGHGGARNYECGNVLRATLIVVKKDLIPILYLWIIPMHRQTQGANPRVIKPADLHALSHSGFGHLYSRCHLENHVAVGWNVVGLMPLTKH